MKAAFGPWWLFPLLLSLGAEEGCIPPQITAPSAFFYVDCKTEKLQEESCLSVRTLKEIL